MDALSAPGETMQQNVGEERCNTRSTFETSKYNSCNIRLNMLLKPLKETYETHLKTIAAICNIQIKHMQRMRKIYATSR
jgi:hypothetical protein